MRADVTALDALGLKSKGADVTFTSDGQKVTYEIATDRRTGKSSAENLRVA